MKTIFVTGGAGFIGSHFIIEALEKGYEVYNLDALTYAADLENLDAVQENPNYHFIWGDIRDKESLDNYFEAVKPDYVAHLAAESHVDRSIENPSIFVETNVLGTQNLLEVSKKYGVKKFLHVSTDEVYGELELDEDGFTETTTIKPNSPYSASKAGSDLLVRSYFQTFNFPAVISRCSNNYGPHQDATKLIPVVISKALKNEKIPVYGKGENIRDWLFVKDHVDALFTVLEKGENGQVYNIGGNNEQTNINLIKLILEKLGKSEDLIQFVADRPGHDLRYAINATKIKNELGWVPRQDFNTLLDETIEWYKEKLEK